jgi:hypothetical protein
MKKKLFQNYLEQRFSQQEIADIAREAKLEMMGSFPSIRPEASIARFATKSHGGFGSTKDAWLRDERCGCKE